MGLGELGLDIEVEEAKPQLPTTAGGGRQILSSVPG